MCLHTRFLSSSVKVFHVNNPVSPPLYPLWISLFPSELENALSRNCFIASVPFTDISAILNVTCISTRKKRFVSLRYAMLINERKFYEIGTLVRILRFEILFKFEGGKILVNNNRIHFTRFHYEL